MFALLLIAFVVLFWFTKGVRAEDTTATVKPIKTPEIRTTNSTGSSLFTGIFRTPKASESPEPKETPKPFTLRVDKLKDLRLKFCEVHHDEISNRSQSLGDLVAAMLGKFDATVTNVENYYTTKVVPGGKSVTNYDALANDIAAKRAIVVKDLASAQADVAGFSCKGDNPKGQITQYRLDMQAVKKALQDYRTSIKNLISAIRSVVGGTESPKPGKTPEVHISPSPVASPI